MGAGKERFRAQRQEAEGLLGAALVAASPELRGCSGKQGAVVELVPVFSIKVAPSSHSPFFAECF